MVEKKLFIGPRLRRFRESFSLTQGEFARQLGVSASYWNQLENNERPLTATVLLKIANCFNIDVGFFSDDGEEQLAAQLLQTLKASAQNSNEVQRNEIIEMVRRQPELAELFYQQLQRYLRLQDEHEQLISRFYGEQHTPHLTPLPHEEVRDYFYHHNNYIDTLDCAAEACFTDAGFELNSLNEQLRDYLQHHLAINVETSLSQQQGGLVRRFDEKNRVLLLASQLSPAQQNFQMASQIALQTQSDLLDKLCNESGIQHQAQALLRIGLANYYAGALIMPYQSFWQYAEKNRYDIEALAAGFHVSLEQICHRLSTLQRKGQQGVPFYFVRLDQAGNISKRQSASSFHFARTGGACPLWNVHDAFASPGQFSIQIARMPDGQKYFCIACTVNQGGGGYRAPAKYFAIGLGCELEHAHRLVYSDGLDMHNEALVTPIGPGCRVCPREHCAQRAFPPAGRALSVTNHEHYFVPYRFAVD